MKVTLNSITGFEDAFATMYISKRTWTPELDKHIREVVRSCVDANGFLYESGDRDMYEEFKRMMALLVKIGKKHITLLRYIDVSFTVEGIHRGAQDDFDAHAKRLDNRIIRSSTRLAEFGDEMSDWYKDKIITTDQLIKELGIYIPDSFEKGRFTYVKTTNGYIREDLKDNKDVKRGLYMLSIPSNFITKCNITEFAHIFKERNEDGGAAPELKECVELMLQEITNEHSEFDRKLMLEIKN